MFLSINNAGTRPVATGLSEADQEKNFEKVKAMLDTTRNIARRVAKTGKEHASSGQMESSNECFSAIAECGKSLAGLGGMAGLVGEALIRLSQTRE